MLALTIWLWTTAVSGVLLLALIGLQRLRCSPASAPRRTELSVATVELTGSAVLAADEDRVAQAARALRHQKRSCGGPSEAVRTGVR